jgi:hypothetical protein
MGYYINEPDSLDEYNIRYAENMRIEGYGVDGVRTHVPCPFCAEPDWLVHGILDVEERYAKGAVCERCHRGVRALIRKEAGTTTLHFVQTEGPDAPVWFPWPMEKVSNFPKWRA